MEYSKGRYSESVEVTRQILLAHGIRPGMRVIVCYPFDPWAIGGIFRDAALACGTQVLPLGLNVGESSLASMILDFNPQVLCGSAGLLVQWHGQLGISRELSRATARIVFHAGEPIRSSVRETCANLWNARIVNVYGMAEFDSIGSESTAESGLTLSPHLKYALRVPLCEAPQRLVENAEGELLIKKEGARQWHRTRDIVRVLDKSPKSDLLWPGCWRIRHISRTDDSLKLPDGSLISAEQVVSAVHACSGVEHVQLQLVHDSRGGATELRIMASVSDKAVAPTPAEFKRIVLSKCLELADAVKYRAVVIKVSFVSSSKLVRTRRGKVKMFVEK